MQNMSGVERIELDDNSFKNHIPVNHTTTHPIKISLSASSIFIILSIKLLIFK